MTAPPAILTKFPLSTWGAGRSSWDTLSRSPRSDFQQRFRIYFEANLMPTIRCFHHSRATCTLRTSHRLQASRPSE